MKLKNTAAAIAAAMAALICSSCAAGASDTGEFTRKADSAANTVTVTADTTAAEAEAAEAAQTTTAQTTTTTTTTTTAPPVEIDTELLSGHSFSIENMPDMVYSNDKLQAALDAIDEICYEYGYSLALEYKNMDSGASAKYNEYQSFNSCSTLKAPFCKQLLESGIDLDEEIAVNVKWDGDYDGKVAQASFGDSFTARELIKLAVNRSDNSAYYNLVNYYGFAGFNTMNQSLGVNYYLGYSWIFTYLTAEDLMRQYEDIYEYGESSKRGSWLIKQMTDTDLSRQITAQLGEKYTVAHKYGSDAITVEYHDCAIVYADSPFVLVILTKQVPETDESDEVFHQLAEQFDIVNSQLAAE